jgi:hypothetical protein
VGGSAPANGYSPRLPFHDIIRTQQPQRRDRIIDRVTDSVAREVGRQARWTGSSTLHLFSKRDTESRSCCARAPVAYFTLRDELLLLRSARDRRPKGSVCSNRDFSLLRRDPVRTGLYNFARTTDGSLSPELSRIESATASVIAACLQESGCRDQPPHNQKPFTFRKFRYVFSPSVKHIAALFHLISSIFFRESQGLIMPKPQGDRKASNEKDRSADVCFYGPNCTRPNCKYKHETPEPGVNVEPCRLDLAGLCRATAETCKKRHVQGVERTWLIQKMARTPCRHALECRTKNCLFKHPSKPEDYARLAAVNGSDANPQQGPRYAGDRLGGVHEVYQSMGAHGDASSAHSPPVSPPVAMPVTLPYPWPSQPLYLGYPMYSYYPHASYYMGMAPPAMYYDIGSYPSVSEYHQPSPILAPNLYAYESNSGGGVGGGAYPRSVSLSGSIYREGSAFVEADGSGVSPHFLPSSPASSTGVPASITSIDEKNDANLLLPNSPSDDTVDVPGKVMLHSDDASSSLTCVVIEATTSVLATGNGGAEPEAKASREPSYSSINNDDRYPTDC